VVELEPNSYHILVNANINNTPVVLIVDSGASRTVIDKIYGAHISRTGLYLALEPWANGKSAGTACKNSPTAAQPTAERGTALDERGERALISAISFFCLAVTVGGLGCWGVKVSGIIRR